MCYNYYDNCNNIAMSYQLADKFRIKSFAFAEKD